MENTTKSVLRHNVFEFKSIEKYDSIDLNSKSKIVLVINEIITDIDINQLFLKKCVIDEDDISGYSILQMLNTNKLKIDDSTILEITFIDLTTGKKFYISKIRRPFAYDNDIYIDTDKRVQYVNILLNAIKPPVMLSNQELITEEVVAAEGAAKASKVLGGEMWNDYRSQLTSQGFKEFIDNNYRFFYKESSEGIELALYSLIPGDFTDIELFEEKIEGTNETYSFKNNEGNECLVVFDSSINKLTINEIVNS